MLNLPSSLTRHFQDASGRFDYQALLGSTDEDLLGVARQMPPQDLGDLHRQLRELRLGWAARLIARAAGVDVESQRTRLLGILERAADGAGVPPEPALRA